MKQYLPEEGPTLPDPNMEANGYGSSSFLANMGGFLVVIIGFLFFVIVIVVFGICLKKLGDNLEVKKAYKKLYYKVFWGMIC